MRRGAECDWCRCELMSTQLWDGYKHAVVSMDLFQNPSYLRLIVLTWNDKNQTLNGFKEAIISCCFSALNNTALAGKHTLDFDWISHKLACGR